MKLKFINLLLAAFLLIGSAQALTSCKDTDEDLYAQLRDDNLKLQDKLEADLKELEGRVKNLEDFRTAIDGRVTTLENEIKNFVTREELNTELNKYVKEAEFNGLVDKYIAAVSAYNNLTEVLNALKSTQTEVINAHGDYESIGARFAAIELALSNLQTTLQNYNQLVSDVATLNAFMGTATTDIANLQSSVSTLNTFMNNWSPKLDGIELNAANALALAQKNEGDIAALTLTYQQLQQMVIDNKTATDATIAALQSKVDNLDTQLQTILSDYMTSGQVDQAISDAIAGLATTDALEALATTLRQEAQANLDAVELRLQEQINTCISRLNGLDTKVGDLKTALDALKGEFDDLKSEVATNTSNIATLQKSLNSVIVRIFNLENRISNIQLEGTENAVLGYLKTPFGIESNFLMNYMGENTNSTTVNFPNFYIEGVEYDGERVFTDADIALLGAVEGAVSYAPGATLFNEADGNLGKIYLTLNPANIDLNGKDFTVVNSQNKVMPIELKNLRPSNALITNGYSRAAALGTSANGFYEADATVANGDVPALRVVVDKELKAAAKKVLVDLKNRTASASSLMALGNAVYNQFNGFLPALGIRAAWQESDGATTPTFKEQSVYSHYGIAAATFQPLSYKFLYGKSFRQFHLPDLSGILDDYKFNFSENGLNIEFKPITIDGVDVNFSLNINPEIGDLNLGTVSTTTNVTIEDFPVDIVNGELVTETKVIPVDVNIDLNESDLSTNLSAAIEDALQNALSGLDGEINSQLQGVIDSLIGQIQGQVNDMMSSLETQVNTSLGDILENLQDQVNGKIDMISNKLTNNALYRRLEALVNKFNGVLADPNHYLQPVLLYSMQGQSFGMFSQSKGLPSQFRGGSAVMLTPTTYTGEIVTPAFKKYVAVTNVYKSTDYKVNAQAGDAKCKALAQAANAQQYMNEVVPGERRTIPFVYEGGEGYTYEIVYQALDYSGVTSTAKYYVSIK